MKVSHIKKEAAIAALNSIKGLGRERAPAAVRTVITSGTICSVKAKLGIPEGPKPWERNRMASRGAGKPVSRGESR